LISNVSKFGTNSIREFDSVTKNTFLVIGTCDTIYAGHINHFGSERLLDVLNLGSMGDQPELPADFLQLYDTQIGLEEQQITLANCLISKNSILFAGQNQTTSDRFNASNLVKSNHYVPKRAICVEIQMPSFILIGRVYVEPWQRFAGALISEKMFIPMTEVLVSSRSNSWMAKFEFAAVNRKLINRVNGVGL
jgi:hypothetical protein